MTQVMEFKNYQLSQKSYDIDPVQYSALLSEAWLEDTSFKSLLSNNSVSIIPFPEMKWSEKRVWEIYCPTKVKIEEYKDFIPVEALEILRDHRHHFDLDKQEETLEAEENSTIMYWYISIWSEAKEVIDPILVGTITTRKKYWKSGSGFWHDGQVQHYLLAQWGESLRPFNEIYKIVKERMIEMTKMAIQWQIKLLKNFEWTEEFSVLEYLNCKNNEVFPYELRRGISEPF